MKKVFKLFGIVIAVILALIIILSVVAKLKEKEIADIALRKISKTIKAPLVIDDISLSLIRRFPFATIELKNIWMGTHDAFGIADSVITTDESLAQIEKVFISVRSIPLFKGELEILKVEIEGVEFSYIVDSTGVSNIDFLLEKSQEDADDTTSADLNLMLQNLSLADIHCSYFDSVNLVNASIVIPEAEVNGKIMGEYMGGSARGVLQLSDCNYPGTNLYLMEKADIDFNVSYFEDSVYLKEFIISTDGADINISGNAVLGDTIVTDININTSQFFIGRLKKYIPQNTLNEIGLTDVSGMLMLNGSVTGSISDSVLPEVKIEAAMKKGYIRTRDYPVVRNIAFTAYLTNGKMRNNQTTGITMHKFHAETGNSSIDLSMNLTNPDHLQYNLNTDIILDLSDLKPFIPDSVLFGMRGIIHAGITTKGVMPDSIGTEFFDGMIKNSRLDITMNDLFIAPDSIVSLESLSGRLVYDFYHFTARDLGVSLPLYKLNLNNTSFDAQIIGNLGDPSKLAIGLNSLQVHTDSSLVYGSGRVFNMEAPTFNFSGTMRLRLGEFKSFLPDTLVKDLSGGIEANFTSNGNLRPDSIADQVMDLVFTKSSFRFNFDKVSVNMTDTLMHVDDLSGKLSMNRDIIDLTGIRGKYDGIDFSIDSTKITNLYRAVLLNKPAQVSVDTRLALGDLNYTLFAPLIESPPDTTASNTAEDKAVNKETRDNGPEKTNYTFSIKGKLRIKSLTYKDAVVDDISALFNLCDSIYLVDQFKFSGFDGYYNTSVKYINKGEQQEMYIKNSSQGLNVTRLLKDFDNFREYYEPSITYENISGILSSKVDAQLLFKNDSMIMDKMYVRGKIYLENGGIYNYPPVQDVAQYLPGVDNLDELKFKTIDTDVFLFQNAVYVPSTLIISNKLDANALGMQSFGEDYDYHIEVFLSDILTGKSQKRLKKQDRAGDEITSAGRSGTQVRSYSENGKSRSGLGNKEDRMKMIRTIKASERLLNFRFFPERVNYDTGVK